jgi:cell division GTPase FtsZ
VKILLLSSGGGGGNILRSLKTLYRRDLKIAHKSDPKSAELLRRAVATRFMDTNEFSLSDVPEEEQLIIGAATTHRVGSMHNPDRAREALEESRAEVESLLASYSVIILIGTGGKGTGAGTMFPLAQMARQQKKLVIPIFVRPSFERHEVEKRRYDHAVRVVEQFDAANIRLIEILNDRGYSDADPQPQSVVWEQMNRPIARGLRGLLYVLWDLSQVDPSDLSALFGGHGRLRIGFSEIDPPARQDPSDDQIEEAVRGCWENSYYALAQSIGTSLVCIQGDWSNVVDGKIKSRLASLALGGAADTTYNPLYARAHQTPKPWGITALFAEYTGTHPPLEIDWPLNREGFWPANPQSSTSEREAAIVKTPISVVLPDQKPVEPGILEPRRLVQQEAQPNRVFSSFREFAVALNRLDAAAVALASNGASRELPIDASELRKLLGTFWFRSMFTRLSKAWQDRLLEELLGSAPVPNHMLRNGRRNIHLSELTLDQLEQLMAETIFPDAVRNDLQLLVTVGRLWGSEALKRFDFSPVPEAAGHSKFAVLVQPFRRT